MRRRKWAEMYCIQCGKPIASNDRFCTACGADQLVVEKAAQPKRAAMAASPAANRRAGTNGQYRRSSVVRSSSPTTQAFGTSAKHAQKQSPSMPKSYFPADDNEDLVKRTTAILIGILAAIALALMLLFVFKAGPFAPVGKAAPANVSNVQAQTNKSEDASAKPANQASEPASQSAAKETWFGSMREENGKSMLVSLKGIEGAYFDLREGPTDGHGFYQHFRIANATVAPDGLSGTCNVEMRWLSQTNLPIQNDVASFTYSMRVAFAPSDPDALICTIENGNGLIQGQATLKGASFKWNEGWMLPRFIYEPDRKVNLTRPLVREG